MDDIYLSVKSHGINIDLRPNKKYAKNTSPKHSLSVDPAIIGLQRMIQTN